MPKAIANDIAKNSQLDINTKPVLDKNLNSSSSALISYLNSLLEMSVTIYTTNDITIYTKK